ncbi:hypothetical protein FRB93_005020 [Tulasnella sp. JGI-2019a]|nr:hypothetical protein FRB93_005020 [Tulasnella sp. JGI-2019a]
MSQPEHKMPPSGTITWTEIPATDLARCQKFYETVFGWKITPMPGATAEPTVLLFNAGPSNGNFKKVAEGDHLSAARDASKSKMGICVTMAVDSIDATLKSIQEAGGETYIDKAEIPGGTMGYVASFLDTEKNVMGLWSMT